MTVYAVIPVHNRLNYTKECIECLRAQDYGDTTIIVVDDGSKDGTAEYLEQQGDIVTLRGNGGLWWAGAIQVGLDYVLARAEPDDYALFLNNDTVFARDFVSVLVKTSVRNNDAVVGSVLVDRDKPEEIIGLGPEMNVWRMQVWDKYDRLSERERSSPKELYELSALSGRGTLFPIRALKRAGRLHPWLLPHYGADYEISARAKRKGSLLLVSTKARTLSFRDFGGTVVAPSWKERYFSPKSSFYIPKQLFFYVFIGSLPQRVTALPRMLLLSLLRRARRGFSVAYAIVPQRIGQKR